MPDALHSLFRLSEAAVADVLDMPERPRTLASEKILQAHSEALIGMSGRSATVLKPDGLPGGHEPTDGQLETHLVDIFVTVSAIPRR